VADSALRALETGAPPEDRTHGGRTVPGRPDDEGRADSNDERVAARARIMVLRGKLSATDAFVSSRPLDDAILSLEEAVRVAEALPGSREQADALVELGFAEYVRAFLTGGEFAPIRSRFDRALEIARALNDGGRVARALFHEGLIHERLGELDTALLRYLESLAVSDACGCLLVQSYAQRHVGFVHLARDEPRFALRHFRRSLELRRQVGFTVYLPYSLSGMADVLLELGEVAEAEAYAVEAVDLASTLDAPRTRAVTTLSLAEVELALGDRTAARRGFQEVLELSEEIGYEAGVEAARDGLERAELR
jgi:tetratricopeptide (TPR) repeat protein